MSAPRKVRIFLFHRISGQWVDDIHATPVSIFEKSVKYISRNYNVKTVEECLTESDCELQQRSSRRVACITFDDGFKDNIEYALPVLDKYKCSASFYIVTGCIDNDLPTWPHLYFNSFKNTRKLNLLIESKLLDWGIEKKFSSHHERIDYGVQLFQKLKLIPSSELEIILNSIMQSFNDVPKPENLMMNWDDVRQLSSAGFTIGSHSHSHPILPLMGNDALLKFELCHSGERLRGKCGKFPQTIAYPLGLADSRVINFAKEAGYKYGLAVGQRFYYPGTHTSLFNIPRMDVYAQNNWITTYLRLTGITEMVKKIVGSPRPLGK